MDEPTTEYDEPLSVHAVSRVEALDLQNLRVKDRDTLDRLAKTLPIVESYFGAPLEGNLIDKFQQITDLNEVTQNNLSFVIEGPDGKMAFIKLGSEKSFQAEFDRLRFVNETFPTNSNDSDIFFPKLIGADAKARAIVTSFEPNSLKVENSEIYLSLLLDGLNLYSQVEPTQINLDRFSPQIDTKEMSPQVYLEFSEKRVNDFLEWTNKLRNSFGSQEERKNGLKMRKEERADYKVLLDQMEKEDIEGKIRERLEIVRKIVRECDLPPLSCEELKLCPTDLKVENTSFAETPDGRPALELFDLESMTFGDMDLAVAKFIQFPTTLKEFESNPELLNTFLLDYANRQKNPEQTLKRLEALVAISNFDLLAGVLRRFPTGPNNYREVYSDRYPTVARALLQVNLPWLTNFLDTPVPEIKNDPSQQRKLKRDTILVKNICPFTKKPPIGNHERWLSEKVKDAKKWIDNINVPLEKAGVAFPFSEEELTEKRPILLGKTKAIENLGDGMFLVTYEYWSHTNDRPEPFEYGYLVPSNERYEKQNGLIVSLGQTAELQSVVNQNFKDIKSAPFSINPSLVEQKMNKVSDKKRFRLFEKQLSRLPEASSEDDPKEIVDIEFIESVNEFFTLAKVKTRDGKTYPLKINRVGSEYTTGIGYVIQNNVGEYVPILNTRALAVQKKEGEEAQTSKQELELIRAFGSSSLTESIARKLNLRPNSFQLDIGNAYRLRNDPSLEFAYVKIYTSKLSMESGKPWQSEEETSPVQEFRTYPLNSDEILQAFSENRTRDPFMVAAIVTDMISSGKLTLSNEAHEQSILLERKFRVQSGNEKRYEIPRGNISTGTNSGEILPNSGNTRDKLLIRNADPTDFAQAFSDQDKEIVSVTLDEAIDLIKNQQLDMITISAITTILLQRNLLTQK